MKRTLESQARGSDANFAYKLYGAVFIALLLGSLLVMMDSPTGSRYWNFLLGNLSFIVPIAIAVVIYRAIYVNRFDFDSDFETCTYLATGLLVLLVLSLFEEILPLAQSMALEDFKGSELLYHKDALYFPLIAIGLGFIAYWMEKKVFKKTHKFPILYAGFLLIVEISTLLKFVSEFLGMTVPVLLIIVGLPAYVVFGLVNRYQKYGSFRIKRKI